MGGKNRRPSVDDNNNCLLKFIWTDQFRAHIYNSFEMLNLNVIENDT